MRLGGGSSTTGAISVSGGALVGTAGAGSTPVEATVVGGSLEATTTGGASVTAVGTGVGSTGTAAIAGVEPAGSCFRYWAATNANASAGGSISSHSPLVLTCLTASPFFTMPSTL